MFYLGWQAWFKAWRNWPVTSLLCTAGFFILTQALNLGAAPEQYAARTGSVSAVLEFAGESGSEDAPTGHAVRVLISFAIYLAVASLLAGLLVAAIAGLAKRLLKLSEEDFDGVKAETGHMSFKWMYENSPKALREARRRAAEEKSESEDSRVSF